VIIFNKNPMKYFFFLIPVLGMSCMLQKIDKANRHISDNLRYIQHRLDSTTGSFYLSSQLLVLDSSLKRYGRSARKDSARLRQARLFTLQSYAALTDPTSFRETSIGYLLKVVDTLQSNVRASEIDNDFAYLENSELRLVKVVISDKDGKPVSKCRVYAKMCGNRIRNPNIRFNSTPDAIRAIPPNKYLFWFEHDRYGNVPIRCEYVYVNSHDKTDTTIIKYDIR
jgi:hypothetical protein